MIVLDTNVLSEALKPSPSKNGAPLVGGSNPAEVFTTAITQAERLYGVELLPAGKRRSRLHAAVESIFAEEFRGRILPFDGDSAQVFPKIVAGRDATGRPISRFDA
jgi:predicted nucleic acid-binding protein